MSNLLAATFTDEPAARRARELLRGATPASDASLLSWAAGEEHGPSSAPALRQRAECIFRWTAWGAAAGALAVELPVLATVFLLPIGFNIQVFLAATLWKMGVVLGAMVGVLLGQEHGLEPEVARLYETHLREGRLVLAVRVRRRDLPHARGILLESGAMEVRDEEGTFEPKGHAPTGWFDGAHHERRHKSRSP